MDPNIVTGFRWTDTMNTTGCPDCGQPAGRCCMGGGRTPKRMVMPHDDRLALYDATYPDRADLYVGGQLDPARHARVNEYNRKISRQEK